MSALLVACQASPKLQAPRGRANEPAEAAKSPGPAAPLASPATLPTLASSPLPGSPKPDAAASLSLPLRLGLSFPASLVGAAAQSRLAGEGGVVAAEGARLSVGLGGLLVSNNGGSLLGNHGGGLLGAGAGLVAQASAGAGPAARRTLQEATIEDIKADRRVDLWLNLLFIDLPDQLLQAYAKAGPKLDAWVPFTITPVLLPPPLDSILLKAYLNQALANAQNLPYTARLARQGDGLTLWVMRLPREGAAPSEGFVTLQMSISGQGRMLTRFATPDEVAQVFGQAGAAGRLEHPPEGGLLFETGNRYRPWEEISPASQALLTPLRPVAEHRRVVVRLQPSGQAEMRLAEAQRNAVDAKGQPNPRAVRYMFTFGFVLPGQNEPGLAYWERGASSFVDDPFVLGWRIVGKPVEGPADQVVGNFISPAGVRLTQPTEALQGLLPAWRPSDDQLMPPLPGLEERLDRSPYFAPEPPPAELLLAP